MWSRKWSLSVQGPGEPPRGSLSQTAESSSRRRVRKWTRSSSHLLLYFFNVRVPVKEALTSVMV